MKMLYWPTLFQASRMAAEQLLALAHSINLLHPANTVELAHNSL